ncbi:MAG: hypothetical protein K9L70_14425 [Thiohalocapsa sp.]|nr:hypothetical protein [Thiohalocapsa sp.]MCF7992297.1 hypothetical protein [Thiohalocapsa sp.]
MDRKIVLSVLAAALFSFLGIWMLLSAFPDERAGLRLFPWDVERDELGRTRVFDLTLGESTLADVRALLDEEGKMNLFVSPDGSYSVEAYFDNIMLGNLRADWIVSLDVPQEQLALIYDRGLRVSKTGSGSRKVKLDPVDAEALVDKPIRTLTYLPWKSLEPEDIGGNFGTPAEQRTEESGVVHWLYPERGMDIARDRNGGVVIQYLNPDDFERAMAPLADAPPKAEASG